MEYVAGFIGLLILLWTCSGSGSKKTQKGDLKIGRDSNGEFYVYDKETGQVIYRGESKKDCAEYIKEVLGK